MIFGFEIGSGGMSEVSYSIRLPIYVPAGRHISSDEEEVALVFGEYQAQLRQEEFYYTLTLTGFPTEEAAIQFLPKVGAGLVWADLHYHIGFRFKVEPSLPQYYESPVEVSEKSMVAPLVAKKGWTHVDGDYDGAMTTVYPEHKKLTRSKVGIPKVTATTSTSNVARSIAEAMCFPHPERVYDDPKLKLAFEIYASSFHEASDNARFLTLVMVLEALHPRSNVHNNVILTINQFIKRVRESIAQCDDDEEEHCFNDYQNLLGRLNGLKKRSFRQGIRSFVLQKLANDPEITDLEAIGRDMLEIYDIRSKLLHDGKVDVKKVKKANRQLHDLVPKVLQVSFRQVAEGS